MLRCEIITNEESVNNYLKEYELEEGFTPLEAVLLQVDGTEQHLPTALLIATVDGKKRVIKTSLRMLLSATGALNAVAERHLGPNWRGA